MQASPTTVLPASRATDDLDDPALLTHGIAVGVIDRGPLGAPDDDTDTTPHGIAVLDPDGDGPPPISPMTGLPVVAVTDIIAQHEAAGGTPPPADGTGSPAADEAPEPPRRGRRRAPRSMMRRLAPLTVGAAAVLVATMVVMLLSPVAEDGPDLSAALTSADGESAPSTGVAPIAAPSALADTVGAARDRATTTNPPPAATAPGQAPGGGAAAGAGAGAGAGAAAGPGRGTGPSANDGTTAAGRFGWQMADSDEFSGGLGKWGLYEGAGHGGNGRRIPGNVSTGNGVLTIRGDPNGNTGGMAYNTPRRFGKWEMRAKFPAGDEQYHPVLILWPTDIEWPRGGEIDFAETTSASDDVSFFLHYGAANNQVSQTRKIDITQWHNYAVEWTQNSVVGYIDGQEWFRSTDGNTLPPGRMHPTIQLDYFPNGGNPRTTEMFVDWMRVYN